MSACAAANLWPARMTRPDTRRLPGKQPRQLISGLTIGALGASSFVMVVVAFRTFCCRDRDGDTELGEVEMELRRAE